MMLHQLILLCLLSVVESAPVPDPYKGVSNCTVEILSIAAGGSHTCALLSNEQQDAVALKPLVKCWGQSDVGALGYGDSVLRGREESQMGTNLPYVNLSKFPLTSKTLINKIYAGSIATCFSHAEPHDGSTFESPYSLSCWGSVDSVNNIGDDQGEMDNLPTNEVTATKPSDRKITVSIGDEVGCYIASGDIFCWGSNSNGLLFNNQLKYQKLSSSVEIPFSITTFFVENSVAVGSRHACGYSYGKVPDGDFGDYVFCWGCTTCTESERKLLLGKNTVESASVGFSTDFNVGDALIRAIVAGDHHTCILYAQNNVYSTDTVICYGLDGSGQLGRFGSPLASQVPVSLGSDGVPRKIASGGNSTCAIVEGVVGLLGIKCWGANHAGQLGVGDTRDRGLFGSDAGDNLPFVSGVDISKYAIEEVDIELGKEHACVRLGSEGVVCWGSQERGALGSGSAQNIGSTEVDGFIPPVEISCEKSGFTANPLQSPTAAPTSPTSNEDISSFEDGKAGAIAGGAIVTGIALAVAATVFYIKMIGNGEGLPVAVQVGDKDFRYGEIETKLKAAEVALQKSGSGVPFDMTQVVPTLLEMGISLDDISKALGDLRNTIAANFSESDSRAVRTARVGDLCKKLHPFKKSVHKYAVFVSHSQKENEWARLMAATIEAHVDGGVFIDLDAGLENLRNLGDLMSQSANLVVLLSEKSICSPWCVLEVVLARQYGVKMVPIVLGQFDYERLTAAINLVQSVIL